jgi:hypothetical protein
MRLWLIPYLLALVAFGSATLRAAGVTDRVVIIKADGLPFEVVDRLVQKKDPYTGKSVLPWIEHVFYKEGTRLSNFYSRGLSLSGPSWAVLDTGQRSPIKGNLEFDRLNLDKHHDYMDVFSFVFRNSTRRTTDSEAAKLLDEYAVPPLSDVYSPSERHVSLQLIVRGLRSLSVAGGLKRLLTLQNPKEWFDEWTMGLDGEKIVFEVIERDLIARLRNPNIRYLDLLVPYFDHTAHVSREPEAQLLAVQEIDGVVKRVWTAIQATPTASTTTMILVSDHGMNTAPAIYSQGFNLIEFFGSTKGGAHHILTNRPPLGAYSFKSLSPTVPLLITASSQSEYLRGYSSEYPTLALDADGNERASIYLRNSDFNILQILWQQLLRKDLSPKQRSAVEGAFLKTVDYSRSRWIELVKEMKQEIASLRRFSILSQSRNADEVRYGPYIRTLDTLLGLQPGFSLARYKIEDLIPKRSLGDANTIYDLQNYIVGLGRDGLVFREDGTLDFDKSLARVDYLTLLQEQRARNNVQADVSARPVDFIAMTVAPELLGNALQEDTLISNAVWLYKNGENQALIIARRRSQGRLELKYIPVRWLAQDQDGDIHFSKAEWQDELPLGVWRDLPLPADRRSEWLGEWHTDKEWTDMLHTSEYSNAVVSLQDQFSDDPIGNSVMSADQTQDERLLARFRQRKRSMARADFIVFANNHWNFNFRGFNPGGNHGAFFRASTHATLMFSGGRETGIPRALNIEEPYDALSFVPTVMNLTRPGDAATTVLPGPVITEIFPSQR